jgi:RNA polymerase sigma factor (sigma-70 family)
MLFDGVARVGRVTQDVDRGVLRRSAPSPLPAPFLGGNVVVAVPSQGRASSIEGPAAPEAEATRALYERYANQIYRYCLHQLGSREEAEDAVQSTFLNAFRGIKRGIVPELESAWLFKIAHNVCLSRRRSSWRRGKVESPADFEVVEELTPAPSRRADELIGLQDVLEEMPETQRRAILLREWQGLSYREIGEELELSQAAVETLIFRARRALASGLEQPPLARRRAVRSLDLGSLAAAFKSLFVGGTTAAKVAATVAAVSATAIVAAPAVKHYVNHGPAHLPPAQTHEAQPPAKGAPTAPVAVQPVEPTTPAAAPAVRRPVTAKKTHTRAHRRPTPAHAAPAAAVPGATASDEPETKGNGHGRSTESHGAPAKEPKEEKVGPTKGTGAKSTNSRRPDAPPSASASPKGSVAVPDEPTGDETNARGSSGASSQGGLGETRGQAKKAAAEEAPAPADAFQEPANADSPGSGHVNGLVKVRAASS